jgi:hypothetical protein
MVQGRASCILKAGALCETVEFIGAAMRRTGATLTIVTIILACSTRGTVGASLPRFPKGTPYAQVRQSLKALGYRPNALPDADDVSRAQCGYKPDSLAETKLNDDMRCFPEMEACAGTGLGPCIFSWRRGDTLIDVLTTHELPVVSGVACGVNC